MITEFLEAVASIMISIASGILGVSQDFFKVLFEKKQIINSEKKQQEILSKKINKLTLSLHESSQLMNEIEAECSGEIVEILAKDEEMVDYGKPLFKIKEL